MNERHTTHFNDCGCLSERKDAEISRLSVEVARTRTASGTREQRFRLRAGVRASWWRHIERLGGRLAGRFARLCRNAKP
jgi:hypothetical protein